MTIFNNVYSFGIDCQCVPSTSASTDLDKVVFLPNLDQVSLGFESLQFPAVTFCNVNPVKLSRLGGASEEVRRLVDMARPETLVKRMVSIERHG